MKMMAPEPGMTVVSHHLRRYPVASGGRNQPVIISILCLPKTTANIRTSMYPSRSVCVDQTNCSVITGTVR
jgi:hypothetical protein